MEVSQIIREALDLWHKPSFTELPAETITDAMNRVLSQHFLDMDLTSDACFATENTRSFQFASSNAREKAVDNYIDDASRVLRVESRTIGSTSDDDWQEESVASYENWTDIKQRQDGNFCAFYGPPGEVKMVVARDVSSLEFRIVYQALREQIASLDQLLGVPDHYRAVLVYDLGMEFGQLIDNVTPEFLQLKQSKMEYFKLRYQEALARIEKWRRSQKGTSITTRRAFNDRRARPASNPFDFGTVTNAPSDDDVFLTP